MIICLTFSVTWSRAYKIYDESKLIFVLPNTKERRIEDIEKYKDKLVYLKKATGSLAILEFIKAKLSKVGWLTEGYDTDPELMEELDTIYESLPRGEELVLYDEFALEYCMPIKLTIPNEI